MRAPLVAVAVLAVASCSSPTSPTPPAALEANGRLMLSCYEGTCYFIGIAINRGTGCADNVRGVVTIRTPDGAVFTEAAWSLPTDRVIAPSDSASYTANIAQNTYPESRIDETRFAWRDVPCH